MVAVLLVVLWATSYSRGFAYDGPLGPTHCLTYSDGGQLLIWISRNGPRPAPPLLIIAPDDRFEILSMLDYDPGEPRTLEIKYDGSVVCAYWIPTLLAAATGVAPWVLRRRFTLRTLLIITTLVAIVLGALVYKLRTKPMPQHPLAPPIQPGQKKEPLFGAIPPRSEVNFLTTHC